VLALTPGALAEGEKCWRLWFEMLMVAESSNSWPAYTDAIEPLDAAPSDEPTTLIIDGEEFDFDAE
jgi:hypothetical protein